MYSTKQHNNVPTFEAILETDKVSMKKKKSVAKNYWEF